MGTCGYLVTHPTALAGGPQDYKGAEAEKPTSGNKGVGEDVAGFGNERNCIYYCARIEILAEQAYTVLRYADNYFLSICDCIINPYTCTSCN